MTIDEKVDEKAQREQLIEQYVRRFDEIKDLPRQDFARQYADLARESFRECSDFPRRTCVLIRTYSLAARAQVANEDGFTEDEKDYVRMLCDQKEALSKYPQAVWNITPEMGKEMSKLEEKFAEAGLKKVLRMLKGKDWEVGKVEGRMKCERFYSFERQFDSSLKDMVIGSAHAYRMLSGEGVQYLKDFQNRVRSYFQGFTCTSQRPNEITVEIKKICEEPEFKTESINSLITDLADATCYSVLNQIRWVDGVYIDFKRELAKVEKERQTNGEVFNDEAIKQHLERKRDDTK